MAFCAITENNLKQITRFTFTKIRENPEKLRDFKAFSIELFNDFIEMKAPIEKAISLVGHLPQIISEFNSDKDNRKLLKSAQVSLDAIAEVEEAFEKYSSLAKYLGLKNETKPIVVVNEHQLSVEKKITDHIADTKVEVVGDVRIINEIEYETRVTSVAKVGYESDATEDERADSPALKHGNTVDSIAKAIFEDTDIKYADFSDKIEEIPFNTIVAKLKDLKARMQQEGYIFRTGVTVYNKALKISGEIDLVAINPKGEIFILDFKSANQRFNEPYLKNDTLRFKSDDIIHDIGMLSKWNQYVTQGYIYGLMLSEQLGIPVSNRVGVIGIQISYDENVPVTNSKIQKVTDIVTHNIPISEVRSEFKGKNLQQIIDEYKKLEGKSLGTVTEIKPVIPQKKTRKRFDDIGPAKPLDRLAAINEIAATDKELQKEIDWFLNNPISKDFLLRLDNTINSGLFGQFTLDSITLFMNASKGTVYHEGWHRFSQVFMSKSQKDVLYNSVRKDNIRFRTRDGRTIHTSNATLIDVEEFLAEEFAKFGLDPQGYAYPTSNPEPKSIFQRIWDFLLRFFGVNPHPITLFQKLYRGQVGRYSPSVNNAYWGKLNSIAVNSRGEEIVPNEKFEAWTLRLDHLIGKEIRNQGKSFTALRQSKVLQNRVFDNIFARLNEIYEAENTPEETKDDLEKILDNRFDFINAYLAPGGTVYDTLEGFKVEEDVFTMSSEELVAIDEMTDRYDDVEDVDENEDASRPEQFGTQPGNEEAAISVADDAIQDYFRSIEKVRSIRPDNTYEYEVDEIGIPINHTYYDIFYRTKKELSGALNIKDMLARLEDPNTQRKFPEMRIIKEDLAKLIDGRNEKNFQRRIQNIQFLQAFYNVMVMPDVNNMQLNLNFTPIGKDYKTFKPTMVSYRRASRSLSLKIIKSWEQNFKDKRNKEYLGFADLITDKNKYTKSPLYLTEDGKMLLNPFADFKTLFPSTNEGVRRFFEILGVNFNSKVFEDAEAMRELKEYKARITKNLNVYGQAKELDYLSDADELLTDTQRDTSQLTSFDEYVKALDNEELDEMAKLYFIENPISFFNEKRVYEIEKIMKGKTYNSKESTDPLQFTFESMAEIEEKFGERISSGAFRIEDKTKYPYYIPNYLLLINNQLNFVENYGDFINYPYLQHLDPVKNPWVKRSYFYSLMFDHNGDRAKNSEGKPITIITEDIASVRIRTDEGITEQHPRSLSPDMKFFSDIMTLFKAGAIEMPRAETSSTMFSVRLSDYGRGKNLPIAFKEVLGSGTTLPETFHAAMKNYFAAEVEKRQWFMKNDPDVKGANKIPLANQFNLFQGILSKELLSKIEKYLDMTPEDIFNQENILTEFRKDVENYFNDRIKEIKPKFDELPDAYKVMIADTVEYPGLKAMGTVAKLFILNRFILSQEYYNLYFGDLYYYKNPPKRGKLVTNTGTAFYIDDYRNQWLNELQTETLHSILTGNMLGGKDFTTLKTGVLKDVVMQSAYVDENDNKNILLTDIINMRVAAGVMIPGSDTYSAEIEKIKNVLAKYNKIDIADGQGIIGLDFYRNFSIITNIWSPEKEDEYKRQKAIFRNHLNLYFKIDEKGNKVDLEGEELERAKENDRILIARKPTAFFNPLKVSYTGPSKQDGPMRPVFDKFSVRPILPEVAIGRRDEAMLLEMTKNDLDYIKFESGSKIYRDTPSEWFTQISEGKYDMNDFTTEEIQPTELYSAYLKHQLSTEGMKEDNILGSQFRKIVFGVKYSPLVRNNPALLKMFTNLEQQFFDDVSKLLDVEQSDLFSLLGIEQKNNVYKIADMKKFLKLLTNESVKRGIAINNIDYIQYDQATKNATYPIDYAFNRQQIQDLLSGLIDERLRRLKVNGSPLIQVSSAGFESKGIFRNSTYEERQKYGTTGLHYYHIQYDKGTPKNISTMGVKVAMSKNYKSLLQLPAPASWGLGDRANRVAGLSKTGSLLVTNEPEYSSGKIGDLESLNRAMKDEQWKAEHLDKFIMVGYRIPTQNNNFIDRMEIMEFLPESAGAIIIAPIELITKSGSDFDIDKLNVIRPVFSQNGQIMRTPKESLEEITKEIDSLTYEERDVRKAERDLNQLLGRADMELSELEKLQKKVRFTILDMTMKSGVRDSLIDSIIKNMEEKRELFPNQRFAVPEKKITEEIAFTDDEIKDYEFDLFQATIDWVKLDQRVSAILAGYEIFKEEKKELGKELTWFTKKRQYKNALNNTMLDTLSRTLAHPAYFEMLVTPSSTKVFDELTNELIAAKENMSENIFQQALEDNEGKLFDKTNTPEENSRYTTSLEAFDNLLSKMKDLGGYAIQRTFADVFNFAKFSIAKTYNYDIRYGETVTKVIHTPLIAPVDRSKVVQNGRILMYGDSVSGTAIKDAFDELISLTVDLANTPAYPKMSINPYNKKHFQYLLHQKVDPKAALWFLNQPVLQELYKRYETERRKKQGYTLKHAITDMAIRMNILQNPQRENSTLKKYEVIESRWERFDEEKAYIEDKKGERIYNFKKANKFLSRPYYDIHQQNLTDADYFSVEDMDKAIRNNEKTGPLQKKVLAYFASMMDEADQFMKIQFANNVDTTKYSTLTTIIRNISNRRNLRSETTLFDKDQLNAIEKQSMIAPFDYTRKAYDIQKALFPKLYTSDTIPVFTNLVTDIFGVKNSQIERISKIVENDYIEFIYKNFGRYNGKTLAEFFTPLLVNTNGAQDHDFFTNQFQQIKNKYPELINIPFVSRLYEDAYYPSIESSNDLSDKTVAWHLLRGWDDQEIHNIFLLRNPDNPTHDKNVFTGNWRNLINFSPEKLGLKQTYSEAQVREISEFFHELIYFSLFQSGLTNTGNGFSDLIPYEHWGHFIQSTFRNLDEALAKNDSLGEELLRVFELTFKQMNPKINWQSKTVGTGDYDENGREVVKTIPFYKNYYRGKDYLVTDDDLGFVRTLLADEGADSRKEPIHEAEPKKEGVLALGRYVIYEGETYIIVKKTNRPNIWQIYNPLKEGVMAKLQVHERNLTPHKESGKIVQYGQKFFLVTAKEQIIDLDKNKKVTWGKDDAHRKNVLELAKTQKSLPELDDDGNPIIRPECP